MEYLYHLTSRPFMTAGYPEDDFIRFFEDGSQFGVLAYSKKLDPKIQNQYSLNPITEAIEIDKIVVNTTNYNAKFLIKKSRNGYYYANIIQIIDNEEIDSFNVTIQEALTIIQRNGF